MKSFCIILLLVLTNFCISYTHALDLKVGVVVPLSGPMSSIGKSIQATINYVQRNQSSNITLIYEDDQFLPRLTVAAVRKLYSRDNVNALIIFGSPTCLSVVEELERQKLPTICISIHEQVTKNKKYIFRAFPTAKDLADVTTTEALKRNYRRVSVVSNATDGLLSISSKFLNNFPQGRLASNQEINPAETELRPYVMKTLADKPDAVLLMLLPQHFGPFVSQMLGNGYKGEFFNAVSLANSSIQKQVKPLAPNSWYAFLDSTKSINVLKKIENENSLELDAEGILGYESIRLLNLARNSTDIAESLRNIKTFPGVFSNIHAEGQDFYFPVSINTLEE